MDSFRERLEAVEGRIAGAAARCGRKRETITLVAVTKVFPASAILDAYAEGLRHFGESYVQEFAGKHADVQHLDGAHFHFIGHLQSNKTKAASELFDVIETVDSAKIARRLNEADKRLDLFLEVKLSEEQSKSGVAPEELAGLIEAVRAQPNLNLRGLMTMPPWSEDPEPSRPYFRKLRTIADAHGLSELSMGMSNDFEAAIEEGATCVRVGTALFGKRKKV